MSINADHTVTGLLGYRLKQTQHAMRIRMDEGLKSLDLTTPQYAVLAQLEIRQGISNAALARFAFITAQTMHGIVSNLEKRYLVTRKHHPQHGRILCTELTEQGHRLLMQAHDIVRDVGLRMTATLRDEDTILFEKLLVECFNNLNGADSKGD